MECTHAELCCCRPASAFLSQFTAHQLFSASVRSLVTVGPVSSLVAVSAARANNIVVRAALLLTAGDIEPNPDLQPHPATGTIRSGYININSAVTKSALIHDLISSFSLDILALSETRFLHNTPLPSEMILLLLGFPSVKFIDCHLLNIHREVD